MSLVTCVLLQWHENMRITTRSALNCGQPWPRPQTGAKEWAGMSVDWWLKLVVRLLLAFLSVYVGCTKEGAQICSRNFPPASGNWKCRGFASLFFSKCQREEVVPGLSSWLTGSWFLFLSPSVCFVPRIPLLVSILIILDLIMEDVGMKLGQMVTEDL